MVFRWTSYIGKTDYSNVVPGAVLSPVVLDVRGTAQLLARKGMWLGFWYVLVCCSVALLRSLGRIRVSILTILGEGEESRDRPAGVKWSPVSRNGMYGLL